MAFSATRRLAFLSMIAFASAMSTGAHSQDVLDEGQLAASRPLIVIRYSLFLAAQGCAGLGYAFDEDDVNKIRDALAKEMAQFPQSLKDEVWATLVEGSRGNTTTFEECQKFRYATFEMMMPGVLAPNSSEPAPF